MRYFGEKLFQWLCPLQKNALRNPEMQSKFGNVRLQINFNGIFAEQVAAWKFILTEQAREEIQCDGICGAEHTSQLQCIQTNRVMDSAGTAESEYRMIHVESLDQMSSHIQPGPLRRTVTIRVIITRLKET